MDVVGVFIPGLPGPMRAGGWKSHLARIRPCIQGSLGPQLLDPGRRRGGPALHESDLRYEDIVGGGGEERRRGKREERNVLEVLGLGKLGSWIWGWIEAILSNHVTCSPAIAQVGLGLRDLKKKMKCQLHPHLASFHFIRSRILHVASIWTGYSRSYQSHVCVISMSSNVQIQNLVRIMHIWIWSWWIGEEHRGECFMHTPAHAGQCGTGSSRGTQWPNLCHPGILMRSQDLIEIMHMWLLVTNSKPGWGNPRATLGGVYSILFTWHNKNSCQ